MRKELASPRLMAITECTAVTTGLLAIIVGTSKTVAADWSFLIGWIVWVSTFLFAVEAYLRIDSARRFAGEKFSVWIKFLIGHAKRPSGLIDLISVIAIPVPMIIGIDGDPADRPPLGGPV